MRLYFTATGLHAVHLLIGIVLLAILAWRFGQPKPPSAISVRNAALYWHLVDMVWVFLYPVLYLMRV
jgi:cytochrome c oxidase subunit 3